MFQIDISKIKLFSDLEVCYYEYCAYTDILRGARSNGYNEEYWNLWSQYMEVLGEYETLKEHLRVEVIVPLMGENTPCNWEVKFEEGLLYITEINQNN